MPSFRPVEHEGRRRRQRQLPEDLPRRRAEAAQHLDQPVARLRKPASVLMLTENRTSVTTTITFDQMPMPNHRMKSGASAMVGVA